jgi:hypothetical protein
MLLMMVVELIYLFAFKPYKRHGNTFKSHRRMYFCAKLQKPLERGKKNVQDKEERREEGHH